MAATHEVTVVRTPKGYLVVPGYVVVAKGDTIVWKNCVRGDIEVLLPSVFPGKLQKSPEGDPMVVIAPGDTYGFHPYAVYSSDANDLCSGQSTPGVIIKKTGVNAT